MIYLCLLFLVLVISALVFFFFKQRLTLKRTQSASYQKSLEIKTMREENRFLRATISDMKHQIQELENELREAKKVVVNTAPMMEVSYILSEEVTQETTSHAIEATESESSRNEHFLDRSVSKAYPTISFEA